MLSKRGGIKKKEILLFVVGFIFLVSFQLVSANSESVGVSESGVEYEDRILEEFKKLGGTNETFVPIIIKLKDFSKANDLLSTFLDDEIKDVAIRDLSKRVGIDITEEAFFKLLQDDRVEGVYYDYPLYLSKRQNFVEKIPAFLVGLFIFIIIIFILYLIIKRKRKK